MRAQVLTAAGRPLAAAELPAPRPGPQQVLIAVRACAVCRTDLHVVDGELPDPKLPLVPGHEIIGTIVEKGEVGRPFRDRRPGRRAVARLDLRRLRVLPLGPREFVRPRAVHRLPDRRRLCRADCRRRALLLCDRPALRRCRGGAADVRRPHRLPHPAHGRATRALLGIYGFGAAAHIVAQVIRHQGRRRLRFTRPGDLAAQDFARSLGAEWAGGSDQPPPEPLDAALIFAPVGALVPAALAATKKGGTVVCGGIHMSDIPSFPYRILWEERVLRSVANLTRRDAEEFLALAPEAGIRTETVTYPLARANDALADLRNGALQGAAVLIP